MKRSKALLVANVLATLYAGWLLWIFGGAIIEAGGAEAVRTLYAYFEFAFALLGTDASSLVFLYVVLVLICVHVAGFALGCLFGWIAYLGRKSGGAKFAAVLYLVGTIAFPVYLFFGLPITIMGFVGGSKQKKLNQMTAAA